MVLLHIILEDMSSQQMLQESNREHRILYHLLNLVDIRKSVRICPISAISGPLNILLNPLILWDPLFKSLKNKATFTYVGSRESLAEARKAEKENLNSMATDKPEPDTDPDDDPEGGEGSLE